MRRFVLLFARSFRFSPFVLLFFLLLGSPLKPAPGPGETATGTAGASPGESAKVEAPAVENKAAGKDYRLRPTPLWVQKVDTDPKENLKIPVEHIADGQYIRLLDLQTKVGPEGAVNFRRYVIKIMNETGLEKGSRIAIDYNPAFEKVRLHSVAVVRNGISYNRLDLSKIAIVRHEKGLSDLIIDGTQTLSLILTDVRIGDSIEYAYSIAGRNPAAPKEYMTSVRTAWRIAIGKFRFRLLYPKNRSLNIRYHGNTLNPVVQYKAKFREYVWTRIGIEPVVPESEVPEWYSPYSTIQLSEFGNWAGIARWAEKVFALPKPDARTSELIEEYGAAKKELTKINSVFQLAQEEIRYFGREMGAGSLVPKKPEKTLDDLYGDCKDKSFLMVSLLRRMGVDARPALVNTSTGYLLPGLLPSLYAFNHVIVHIKMKSGRILWLDPTRTFQRGSAVKMATPNYHYALVVGPNTNALTPIVPRADRLPDKVVREVYDLSGSPGEPVTLTIETKHRGKAAEELRSDLARSGITSVSQGFKSYMAKFYSGVSALDTLEVNDRRAVIRTYEEYSLSGLWQHKDDAVSLQIFATEIAGIITMPSYTPRTMPYQLPWPQYIKSETILLTPRPWAHDPFTKQIESPFFTYTIETSSTDSRIKLVRTLKVKRGVVYPSEVAQFTDDVARLNKSLDYWLHFESGSFMASKSGGSDAYSLYAPLVTGLAIFLLAVLLARGWIADFNGWLAEARPSRYYPMPISKFILLSVASFGCYPYFWLLRNWMAVRQRDQNYIRPWFRALFDFIWFIPLWSEVHKELRGGGPAWQRWAALLLLIILRAGIVSPWPLIHVFVFLPYLPLLGQMNKEARETWQFRQAGRLRVRHVLLLVGAVVLFGLQSLPYTRLVPGITVYSESRISNRYKSFLVRQGLLLPTETAKFFYSDVYTSILYEGTLVTDQKIVHYWREADGSLGKDLAEFNQVTEVRLLPPVGILDPWAMVVKRRAGTEMVVLIGHRPSEARRLFHYAATKAGGGP